MEFKGIDVPPDIRGRAIDLERGFDDVTGKRKRISTEIPAAILRRIDRLQKTAERRLLDFRANYWQGNKSPRPSKGWALIKKYENPGTAFLFVEDKIAPDSVVVSHLYRTNDQGEEVHWDDRIWWVSPEKDPRNQLPFIYSLRITEDSLRITEDEDVQVKPFPWNIQDREKTEMMAQNFFACQPCDEFGQIPGLRYEYEIWKQGKSMPQRSKRAVKRRPVPSPLFKRQSKPVSI